MSPVYTVLGALVLGATFADLLWTTLWASEGAGPFTRRLMKLGWDAFRRVGGRRSRLLSLSGPAILVISLGAWFALLWVGWTLVFAGAEGALIDTRHPGSVSWGERFYFAGYSLFTLGNGGFAPQGNVWQIMTVLTTASGMSSSRWPSRTSSPSSARTPKPSCEPGGRTASSPGSTSRSTRSRLS